MKINTPMYNRLLIIDGSHCLHRAMCQPELYAMQTSTGIKTGGVVGVIKTIIKEFRQFNYYPVVVFDGGLSKRRLELYPNYKRHQDRLLEECKEEKTEEQLIEEQFRREYNTQRKALQELLPYYGIPVVQIDGWEGDDLIYILTKMSLDSIVLSDDKDLLQLIHEPDNTDNRRCRVKRGMRDEFWDMNSLKEKNFDIQEYIACKAIVGDTSDNIPSACYQVGEKTAPDLFKIYKLNNIEKDMTFPENEEDLAKICKELGISKRKAYLNFNEDQFLTNIALTDLSLVDDEITQDLVDYIYRDIYDQSRTYDTEEIHKLLENYEIRSIDSEKIVDRVGSVHILLELKDYDRTKNIIDINQTTQNKLFNF